MHFLRLWSCVITAPVNKTRSETDVFAAISKQNVSHLTQATPSQKEPWFYRTDSDIKNDVLVLPNNA